MSTLYPVRNILAGGTAIVMSWPGVKLGDDFAAFPAAEFAAGTVQVAGVFGGASVVIDGSIDGETFSQLSDRSGNALLSSPSAASY